MEHKITHLIYCPFTGLGLYNGFRGNRWLANRIKIFKQFVVPSLQAQTNKNFTLWVSWRREERHNPHVKALTEYLNTIKEFKTVHTFGGLCFYDDKYESKEARERLIMALHCSTSELFDIIGQTDVLMTIQPSDDCYRSDAIELIQKEFESDKKLEAVGFRHGYICDYFSKEVSEYNPKTNPPFYTIKFPREDFFDPFKHCQYTGLKKDVGQYKVDTPIPSHEYVGDCLNYKQLDIRGFLVGCHSENVSTYYNHPFKGLIVSVNMLKDFGLFEIKALKLKWSLRKWILKKMPHKMRRKLRYWWGEKVYNWIRS